MSLESAIEALTVELKRYNDSRTVFGLGNLVPNRAEATVTQNEINSQKTRMAAISAAAQTVAATSAPVAVETVPVQEVKAEMPTQAEKPKNKEAEKPKSAKPVQLSDVQNAAVEYVTLTSRKELIEKAWGPMGITRPSDAKDDPAKLAAIHAHLLKLISEVPPKQAA